MTKHRTLSEAECLTDALCLLRHDASVHPEGRPERMAAVMGSRIALPAGTPLWRHASPGSRELHPVPYEGQQLTVHDMEPAGASFLVHADGQPHARRGPALTLREVAGQDERLLVVFSSDVQDSAG